MSFEGEKLEKPVVPSSEKSIKEEKLEGKKNVPGEYTDLLLAKEGEPRELTVEESQDIFLGHLRDLMQRTINEEKKPGSLSHEEVLDRFVFKLLTFVDGDQSQRIPSEQDKWIHYPGIKMVPDISKEDVDSCKKDGLNWLSREDISGDLHERWYS